MRNIIFLIAATLLLFGCSKLHPYRVEVQQGNIVDAGTKAQLHLGMDKSEVNSLLGTPVLGDMFNNDTWIYVYIKQPNRGKTEKKKLILEFKNNKLVQIN